MNRLSIDVGGTFIKWGVINEGYEIIESSRIPTPKNGLKEFINVITTIYKEQAHYDIKGIGFSLPGTMDTASGNILHGGSIRYLDNINFIKEFSMLGIDITIENDARCALYAEKELGTLRNVENAIVFILGTGVGGGILIDKQIYKGTNFYAGEFSLIKHGRGDNALLGNELSVPGLVNKIKESLGMTTLSGEEMIDLVQSNNKKALTFFNEYISTLVDSLISIQFIFSVEKIAIGGGISKNAFFVEEVKKKYHQELLSLSLPVEIPVSEITVCDFQSEANLIGAYLINKSSK